MVDLPPSFTGPVTWRDGQSGRVRPTTLDDAADLWNLERQVIADGRGVVMDACDLPSPDVYRGRMLEGLSGRGAWFVAEASGQLCGQARLSRHKAARIAHVGWISVEVHPNAQGIGVGRALCEALIAASDALGVLRLELYVRADNHRAIALYQALGFTAEGLRQGFVRLADGALIDDWCLVRFAAGFNPAAR